MWFIRLMLVCLITGVAQLQESVTEMTIDDKVVLILLMFLNISFAVSSMITSVDEVWLRIATIVVHFRDFII